MGRLLEPVRWDEAGAGWVGTVPIRQAAAGGDERLDPSATLAAMAALALGPPDLPGPPLRRERPRFADLESALEPAALARWLPPAARPEAALTLAAGLLQVHDFWDRSHEVAQEADDLGERQTSAYWHGIAHRREPDASNANYWFRRVGRHPVLEPLGRAAVDLIASCDTPPLAAQQVAPAGVWSPPGFIDIVAAARPDSPVERLARRLQRLEMIVLLEHSARAAGLDG